MQKQRQNQSKRKSKGLNRSVGTGKTRSDGRSSSKKNGKRRRDKKGKARQKCEAETNGASAAICANLVREGVSRPSQSLPHMEPYGAMTQPELRAAMKAAGLARTNRVPGGKHKDKSTGEMIAELEMLHAAGAMAKQSSSTSTARVHLRKARDEIDWVTSDTKGVSFSYKRKSVRVKGQVDGKKLQKYIKVATPEVLDDALKEAQAWAMEHPMDSSASGISPRRTRTKRSR